MSLRITFIVFAMVWPFGAAAEVVRLEERFQIVGVISDTSNDKKQAGIAVLHDLSRQKKTLVVRAGSPVPGYPSLMVVEIRRNQVTISDGRSSQILSYQGFQTSRSTGTVAAASAASDSQADAGGENHFDQEYYDPESEIGNGGEYDPILDEVPPPPTSDGQRVERAMPTPQGRGRSFENWRGNDPRQGAEGYVPPPIPAEAPSQSMPHPDDF